MGKLVGSRLEFDLCAQKYSNHLSLIYKNHEGLIIYPVVPAEVERGSNVMH